MAYVTAKSCISKHVKIARWEPHGLTFVLSDLFSVSFQNWMVFSLPTLCVSCLEVVPDIWRRYLVQGSDFVAYVTADTSCSSKHVDQPVGNHVDYWPFCRIYLLCDCSNLMTVVRLCLFDVPRCVLGKFGEIVLSVKMCVSTTWILARNWSCAPNGLPGGKMCRQFRFQNLAMCLSDVPKLD